MPGLTLTLFGSFCLARDGVPLRLRSRKCLALLAYLAVTGRSHRREHLAALFWPESDGPHAQNSLRYTLSALRRALDGAWLQTDRETLGLDGSERVGVDVVRFRELLRRCRSHGHAAREACVECLPLLEEAVELHQGDFMAGFALRDAPEFDGWQTLEQEALRRELGSALGWLADGYAAQGEMEKAVACAQRRLALDPPQEAAHRTLMRLYAGSGRRTEALRQFQSCESVLRQELGVGPSAETRELYEAVRGGRIPQSQVRPSPASAAAARPHHNLPVEPTRFVGRETELDQVARLLSDPACRLLTVVGPGGMGKTRLAIQAAEEHISIFRDGVWFVPLASVDSVDLLPSAIMDSLGVARHGAAEPKDQLARYLRPRSLLLVLDSFEHLMESVRLVTEMVAGAPGLKVVVTSRQRLNVRGEWLLPVEGMAYPGEDGGEAGEEDYSAIELFGQCARRVQPDFALASAGPSSVARICRLVEGMPLAIELAAAWVRVMGCAEIARELEKSMDLLTTTMRDVFPRHRSMRAVLDHSWGLLTNAERGVLGALAVFRGGFLREGAGAVAGASLATLSALIDKSWIRRSPSGRYEMHELIMQYCFEKLDAQPDEDGTTSTVRARDRHSQYYGAFLRAREPHLHGLGQAEAFAEILQEMHNVRAGWRWAVECGDVETLSSYLETLWYAGVVRAWHHEVLQLLEEAAAVLGRQPDPIARDREGAVPERATLVLSEILSQQAAICEHLGLRERGIMLCEESLALLPKVERGARRDRVAVSTKVMLGELWRTSGHTSQARQCLREALALADETGDEWGKENSLFFLGTAMRNLGRYSEAEGLLQQAIAIADETGEQWGKAACLDSLSWVLCAKGDYHAADRLAQESLRIRQCLGDQAWLGYSFVRLGETAAALGNAELATQHYHQGLAVANEVVHPALRGECLRGQATLASLLGQHEEAQQLFEDTRRTAIEAGEVGLWTDALVGLGHAACALGEAQQARAWLCEALEKATRAERAHATTSAVTGLASLASREGDTERAVELLALVLDHPATTQVTKDRASQLLAELAPELSAELFAEAMERGQARELGEVAAELLGGGADAADGD